MSEKVGEVGLGCGRERGGEGKKKEGGEEGMDIGSLAVVTTLRGASLNG